MRHRRLAIAGGVTALLSLLPTTTALAAAPDGSSRPTVTALPMLSGAIGGQVISGVGDELLLGGVNEPDGSTKPVLWYRTGPTRWTVVDLSNGGTINANANDMDRHGTILFGTGEVRTVDGQYRELKNFGTPSSFLYTRQMNRNGVIAGGIGGTDPNQLLVGAVWQKYNAVPSRLNFLPFPNSSDSVALGINGWGDTVGDSDNADFSDFRGGFWPAGHADGVILPGLDGTTLAAPSRINDHRLIVGEAANADFSRDGAAVWYGPQNLRFLGTVQPGDAYATLFGVSQDDRAVGTSVTGDFAHFHVIYWPGHGPLKALPPLTGTWATDDSNAHYVSEDGLVGGNANDASGQNVPVVWTNADRQAFVPPASAAPLLTLKQQTSPRRFRQEVVR